MFQCVLVTISKVRTALTFTGNSEDVKALCNWMWHVRIHEAVAGGPHCLEKRPPSRHELYRR